MSGCAKAKEFITLSEKDANCFTTCKSSDRFMRSFTLTLLYRCHTCDFIARHYRAIRAHSTWLIVTVAFLHRVQIFLLTYFTYTATLSHKQELTNQASQHYRDKVAQNTGWSKKVIPLVHILHCTRGITFLAHPV